MFLIDCKSIDKNRLKQLEEVLIKNNLNNKVIINYKESYDFKNICIKNLSMKKYFYLIKKSQAVFLFDDHNINILSKYNKNIFVIDNINNLPKIIKNLKYKNKYIKVSIFSFILIILLAIYFILLNNKYKEDIKNLQESYIESEINTNICEEQVDYKNENIVFTGDSITDFYDTDKFFDGFPIVNTGVSGYKVDNIYNDLNKYVYMYNPTKVVLLIGTNDFLDKDKENDYIVNKINDIINQIRENRPKAEIYLESIYPINNTDNDKINHNMVSYRENDRIIEINKELEKICDNKKCTYIDMYSLLKDDDGNLKLDYTVDGLHISDKGYEVITKKLKEVLKLK